MRSHDTFIEPVKRIPDVRARIAVISGTGFDSLEDFREMPYRGATTPYGLPSEAVRMGRLGSAEVAFLSRHGPGHQIPPHRINHRANVWALKELGVLRIVAVSSVGSLHKELPPGRLAVPHDYLCLSELPTFFDEKVVHQTPTLDERARKIILAAGKRAGFVTRSRAVYAQTRGPRLETKAEVRMLSDYADVVGMTMASEATLAAEAGMGYASMCTVDNYANGIGPGSLSYETILKGARKNAERVRALLPGVVRALASERV